MSNFLKEYPVNFSRAELLRSITATNLNIDNSPISEEVELNLVRLAEALQKIRGAIFMRFGVERSIHVSSGYRCPDLNLAITGNPNSKSRHQKGLAADINVQGWSSFKTAEFIRDCMFGFEFHKVINEYGSWVHISLPELNESPLGKFITAKKVDGETKWLVGVRRA